MQFRPSPLRIALAAGLLVATAGAGALARAHYAPSGLTLPGLTIDGAPVPATLTTEAELRAWIAERAQLLGARHVRLVIAGDGARVVDEASLAELGVVVDVDRVVARATAIGRDEDLLERIARGRRAREGALDVPLAPAVDAAIARGRLEHVKEMEDAPPVSARLDLENHGVIPEKDGRYIDADGSIAAIARIALEPTLPFDATVTLPVAIVPPRFTSAYVATLEIGTVLSEYETYFSRTGDQKRRGKNIDVAASKLDGIVLTPGEMFSFNALVGERSEENGFQKSWEILKGEMVEGVGGGTCQVASTLHAVAFFGGLEILERLPHSRPSAYIPMGLDATVVYPEVDLKLRNPHPFPVVVHAKVEGNRLHVQLLGAKKVVSVSFARELLETFPFKRKVEEDDTLTANRVVIKQHGIRGFKIKRTRTLAYRDGHVKKEETTDKYPATTEIYEVTPGFDVTLLPALPTMDGDEGEGSDASAQTAANAAAVVATPVDLAAAVAAGTALPVAVAVPPSAPAGTEPAAVACTGECARPVDLSFVDAPGAHAPTQAQARPPKRFSMRR
jgi:vancomycin resistance protein YoaR